MKSAALSVCSVQAVQITARSAEEANSRTSMRTGVKIVVLRATSQIFQQISAKNV